jgi:hypothetical protein
VLVEDTSTTISLATSCTATPNLLDSNQPNSAALLQSQILFCIGIRIAFVHKKREELWQTVHARIRCNAIQQQREA